MALLFRSISYLFHPLFVPIAGTAAYFIVTPKYTPLSLQSGNILPIFILTVIIPIICFFILKNLRLVQSAFLVNINERRYALLINIVILLMIVLKVIPNNYVMEVYYYFIGLLTAVLSCFFLLFIRFKASLHVLGIASFLMYLIALSIHFELNIIVAISAFTLLCGLVATSRLFLNKNSKKEVIAGFMIGIISQLITLKFWL